MSGSRNRVPQAAWAGELHAYVHAGQATRVGSLHEAGTTLVLLKALEHGFLGPLGRRLGVFEARQLANGIGPQRVLEGTKLGDSAGTKFRKQGTALGRDTLQR